MNRFKKNFKKLRIIAVVFLILSGCRSVPFGEPKAGQVLMQPEWKDEKGQYSYLPGEILVETDLYGEEIHHNAEVNLALLLDGLNQSLDGNKNRTAKISVSLREYSFMKEFKPLKSLSLNMEIRDESGKVLGSYYYSTESSDSYFSSAYLYRQLNRGIGKLF